MGFAEAVRTVLKRKYAVFSGRASRSEFWWFQLFLFMAQLVLGLIGSIGIVTSIDFSMPLNSPVTDADIQLFLMQSFIWAIPLLVFDLAVLIPSIAVSVRRLHDMNMSGWWYLGFIVLFIIPVIQSAAFIGWIVLMCFKGTKGSNRFGKNPLRTVRRRV